LKGGGWGTVEPERVIRTTQEHPFYVQGKGWTPLAEIRPGDLIRTDNGWVPVTKIEDTGRYETVYNLRVQDYHTYFVGAQDWGFGVWAHNAYQPGKQDVEISKLIPPSSRPFADPAKLARHGPFDWKKYTPIIVETDGTSLWLMDGMTRVENARRAGITHLPANVYRR
jgi:hypothetical protein